MKNPIWKDIERIPEGYSEGIFNDRKYGITKAVFNNGKSVKVYGKELGGNDFVSLNYYITRQKELLKPCEMPATKVEEFLAKVVFL